MSVITSLADAITRQEGGNPSNNNPGNLMDPNRKIWPQYPHASNGAVIFPSAAAGRAALENDLSIKVNRGMTLSSLLNMYAPPSENDTPRYIANVSSWTGFPADVPLNQLDSFQPSAGDGSQLAVTGPFPDDQGALTPEVMEAGILGFDVTPEMLVGLLLAGALLWFYFDD